jgi:DNA-binding FrmR family transcriptional regulator
VPYLSDSVQRNIQSRLNRIEGQVRGIKRMIDEQADCDQILMQIASLRAALLQTGRVILDDHIKMCVTQCVQEGQGDEALEKLGHALDRLLK